MRPKPRHALLYGLLAAASLLGGCIRPALPPPSDLAISRLDTLPLKGKTIVIDPGHGGPERGAISLNGLCEAEVNLGVALYLWGFFKEAGANPVLTRTADVPVFKEEPFVLRNELAARADFSNSRPADLFVSIHHNSDGRQEGDRNDLIIFFKMSDPGCSRDVAREVCAALQQRLQAEPASARPGNYMVLRSARAAAILGEASYMNYRKNAEKLAYHRTLAAEAQGYFLGILNYFAKGVPAIEFVTAADEPFAAAQPAISARLTPGAPGATVDRDSVQARLDGRSIKASLQDGSVTCAPEAPLANGGHELCLDARNSAGNAARRECLKFTVSLPPARLAARAVFPVIPADGQSESPIDITVQDGLGRPVIDGTPLGLSTTAGSFAQAGAVTKNGRARVFLKAGETPQTARFRVQAGALSDNGTVGFGVPATALFEADVTDDSGRPVAGAALVRDQREIGMSDESGRVFDSVAPGGLTVKYGIRRKGYEPQQIAAVLQAGRFTKKSFSLRKVAGGSFFNRTVMLDPAGQSQEMLPLLRELKALIEAAGGTALFTWENHPAPGLQSRVMRAAEAKADLYICLDAGRAPAAEFFYKSAQGEKLAGLVCGGLNGRKAFGKKSCEAEPGTEYVLMQTSMPALLLRVPKKMKIAPRDVAGCLYDALEIMFDKGPAGSTNGNSGG